METEQTTHSKNIGTVIHLCAFAKYLFPFGNFIFPLIFWMANRKNAFIDSHGKQCLNFQISTFIYGVGLLFIAIFGTIFYGISLNELQLTQLSNPFFRIEELAPFFPYLIFIGTIALLLSALFLLELVCVVTASIKASEGKVYKYPVSIQFIGSEKMKKEDPTLKKQQL